MFPFLTELGLWNVKVSPNSLLRILFFSSRFATRPWVVNWPCVAIHTMKDEVAKEGTSQTIKGSSSTRLYGYLHRTAKGPYWEPNGSEFAIRAPNEGNSKKSLEISHSYCLQFTWNYKTKPKHPKIQRHFAGISIYKSLRTVRTLCLSQEQLGLWNRLLRKDSFEQPLAWYLALSFRGHWPLTASPGLVEGGCISNWTENTIKSRNE